MGEEGRAFVWGSRETMRCNGLVPGKSAELSVCGSTRLRGGLIFSSGHAVEALFFFSKPGVTNWVLGPYLKTRLIRHIKKTPRWSQGADRAQDGLTSNRRFSVDVATQSRGLSAHRCVAISPDRVQPAAT